MILIIAMVIIMILMILLQVLTPGTSRLLSKMQRGLSTMRSPRSGKIAKGISPRVGGRASPKVMTSHLYSPGSNRATYLPTTSPPPPPPQQNRNVRDRYLQIYPKKVIFFFFYISVFMFMVPD